MCGTQHYSQYVIFLTVPLNINFNKTIFDLVILNRETSANEPRSTATTSTPNLTTTSVSGTHTITTTSSGTIYGATSESQQAGPSSSKHSISFFFDLGL